MKNRILVPVTPSNASKEVIRIANEWGSRSGGKLYFIHIIRSGMVKKDQQALQSFLKGEKLTAEYQVNSYLGKAYQVILEEELKIEPDFILMAAHSHQLLKRVLLGSVSDYIFNKSKGSVYLHKVPLEEQNNIIIVPVDYKKINEKVIELADSHAQDTGAELCFIHVFTPPAQAFYNMEYVWQVESKQKDDRRETDRIRNITYEEKEKLKSFLGCFDIKSNYKEVIEYGKPYLKIMELQQNLKARLVAMASHSYTIPDRILPGSVTKFLLQNGDYPIFVYKE